jgi:hypothetical protein
MGFRYPAQWGPVDHYLCRSRYKAINPCRDLSPNAALGFPPYPFRYRPFPGDVSLGRWRGTGDPPSP